MVHVIIHGHIEEVVGLVPGVGFVLVKSPSEAVTVSRSLCITSLSIQAVIPTRVDADTIIHVYRLRCPGHVYCTKFGIVSRVSIEAVLVIWVVAVSVVVSSLAVGYPAAHGCSHLTVFEVIDVTWPFKRDSLSNGLVQIIYTLSIASQDVGWLIRDESIVVGLVLFVPEGVSIEVFVVKVAALVCDLAVDIIPLNNL